MRSILLTCLAAVFCLLSFRAPVTVTVKGKVTDEKGKPVAGASVLEKGTKNAGMTDGKGMYEITVAGAKSVLVFSYVGYSAKQIPVKGQTEINVTLKPATNQLDEVVAVGYGTLPKKSVTGSVSKISAEEITMVPAAPDAYYSAPLTGLQGRVPGLAIQSQPSARSRHPVQSRQSKSANKRLSADTVAYPGDFNTEGYDAIIENRFLAVDQNPLSTFSIDVDPASYSNVRRFLQAGRLPPAGAVRIEEMINYFHYDYPSPDNNIPFSINTEVGSCPWSPQHQLVLVGLQGKKIPAENLPPVNLVFLIDVSGSMDEENKLPLVKSSMKLLVDQLREQDKVAIVVYAGNAGLVLPSTSGASRQTIKDAIDRLDAGGSTAGGAGIKLAYQVAKDNFIKEGNNRVVLCTDGDFNVGVSSNDELETLITKERESHVFLTVLGYGTGNYQDSKMQQLADKGNGNHAYIDNFREANKVLVSEFGGTLFTIAKDVKLQIEFNPAAVQAYRLIGYENRLLTKEDFNNDKKDAGELGSGHTVTALYEVIPVGVENTFAEKVDPLKYQQPLKTVAPPAGEMMTIKFRYKQPTGNTSQLITHTLRNSFLALDITSANFRFAAAVAEFGLLLRKSEFKQQASFGQTLELARGAMGNDEEGYRSEFIQLLKTARDIAKTETPAGDEQLSRNK
jgi:Ca-activated chloride channel family protein